MRYKPRWWDSWYGSPERWPDTGDLVASVTDAMFRAAIGDVVVLDPMGGSLDLDADGISIEGVSAEFGPILIEAVEATRAQ